MFKILLNPYQMKLNAKFLLETDYLNYYVLNNIKPIDVKSKNIFKDPFLLFIAIHQINI